MSLDRLHRIIELFLNGLTNNDDMQEMRHFEAWLRTEVARRSWVPYRTEWSIYDEDIKRNGL
jgi:hypothetical protein